MPDSPSAAEACVGLLGDAEFWSKESGAPLLRRNAGFIPASAQLPAHLLERVSRWPALCGVSPGADGVASGICDDEGALRIFLRDAERTFKSEDHRSRMIDLLKRVWPENKDYHQGLGYVSSFLMLFLDEQTTLAMLLRMTREEMYTPGYWRAAPDAYVRDAMVYGRLVAERHPEVSDLLQQACIVPEAYASKWFVGLCVHVLPFEALFSFLEAYLTEGYLFLFKFSLALIAKTKEKLLSFQPTQVNLILEVLRLETCHYPDDAPGFFSELVAEALEVELSASQVASLREEEGARLAEKQRRTKEREAQMAAEESDDEIVFSDETDEDDD